MGGISTQELLYGYTNGIFPMAESDTKEIFWYSPDPRAIIPIDAYKPSKSLKPTINSNKFEIKIDTQFEAVMRYCAQPRFTGDETWISEELVAAYNEMHILGLAHSVEVYFENQLVGGLYGVAIGGVFFGESMFHKMPNASKIAFHFLIQILKNQRFELLDTQFINDNVKRFGAIEIPKVKFMKLLSQGLKKNCVFVLTPSISEFFNV
jgi:leucyl/phenylalanyl-tRNA---protein transferase